MEPHPDPSGNGPLSGLVLQFLGWVAARPRTYGETMGAWRTSCPRLPVWEDAIDGGLVQTVSAGRTHDDSTVHLTEAGRARLASLNGGTRA